MMGLTWDVAMYTLISGHLIRSEEFRLNLSFSSGFLR